MQARNEYSATKKQKNKQEELLKHDSIINSAKRTNNKNVSTSVNAYPEKPKLRKL